MIRKGQMLSIHSQISDVIFGLRECEQINGFIERLTHSSYEKAVDELKKRWFDSHQMILSQYEKNSLYVMPLANLNENFDAYMFSVSEVILRIIKTTARRINLLPKEFNGQNFQSIVSVVSRLTFYLFFDIQYETFSKELKCELKKKDIDEDKKLYNSPVQGQICNFFSVFCQNIIKERIKIGETDNPNEKEIKKEIEKLCEDINVIATIYLPMHLADTYIPFDEFFQLMYDIYQQSTDLIKDSLPKWTKGMSFPKIPQLTQIKKDEKICFSDVIDEGIDAAKNGAGIGFTLPAFLGPLGCVAGIVLLFTPLSPIGATIFCVSAGVSFIGPFAGSAVGAVAFGATAMAINGIEQQSEINRKYKNKVEKQKTEHKNLLGQINYEFQETVDKFVFYYPLLWDKEENILWKDYNKKVITKQNETFLIFISLNNLYLSPILKAFLGKPPEHINMMCQISNSQIEKRFSQIGKSNSRTKGNFTVICPDLPTFSVIFNDMKNKKISKSNIIIIYTKKITDSMYTFQDSMEVELHILLMLHDESNEPYTKERILELSKNFNHNKQIQTFNTLYHPIETKNLDFTNEGPRCNTTLKDAFQSILYNH